jgi:hypothetical protein
MGADFLYAMVPKCELTAERTSKIQQVLDSVSDHTILCVAADGCMSNVVQDDDESRPEDVTEKEWEHTTAEKLRGSFFSHILEALDSGEDREVSWLGLDDLPYQCWITGGLSWGDSPTDIFDSFVVCGELLPVWELLLEFAKEDYAAQRAGKES